jgi:response regulator RpfG family c-di-GMP phosphodiesterase
MSAVSKLAAQAAHETIEGILATAREMLEMDMAYVAEFADGRQVMRYVEGDGSSFGAAEGSSLSLDETYCQRMVNGDIPNVITDTESDGRVACLTVTGDAGIGSYIGVPVRVGDDEVYGSLCCLDHDPNATLGEREVRFLKVLAKLVGQALEHQAAEEQLQRTRAQAHGLEALLAALAARDNYTGDHSASVVGLAVGCARRLRLRAAKVAEVEQVALLHDIGKVGIPDAILHKPGRLTKAEWEVMREHPKIGSRLVASIEALSHLAPAVRAEHERWDGKGYPDGLVGNEIPVVSRIVFACDAYHAMTSDRPYRKAMSSAQARAQILENAGTQFWPEAARALVAAL